STDSGCGKKHCPRPLGTRNPFNSPTQEKKPRGDVRKALPTTGGAHRSVSSLCVPMRGVLRLNAKAETRAAKVVALEETQITLINADYADSYFGIIGCDAVDSCLE